MEEPSLSLREVEAALRGRPGSFGFFQAVRLLERMRPDRRPVGEYGMPGEEVVHFSVNPSLAFPASEIASLRLDDEGPARMSVNFMGLTGPLGVLPYHYSLIVAERQRARDPALADFLDLFHHRIISLFYRAWEKHHFAARREEGRDRLADHFLDLAGAGLEAARRALPLPPEAVIHYAGLLIQPRSAVALEQLVEDYFGVPVEVEQFVGGWHRLSERDQCALGEEGAAPSTLGLGSVVGDEVWDPQMRVRVRLGPLSRPQFDRFLPTGEAHEALRALVRFFCQDQFEFELQLVLAQDEVPACVLDGEAPQHLGWSTWLRSRAFARDAEDTLLRL